MSVGKDSFIKRYGVNFTEQEYVVNPAIGREKELRELSLVLLTPEKSAILTGKPGIGKTAIVEGLAYLIQRDEVPDALKGYTIIKVDTQALMGTVQETGDSRVQTLIDEILEQEKYILFIDEIHTLINATTDSALDFANMFKTGLGRGDLKVIGATTSDEYERYILRDKAFTRRFQRINIAEPDQELTVKIVTGVIPRIEHNTGIKMGYTPFIQEKLARFIVEVTTEYNRVYENAARYPDVAITMMSQAFSEALFENKKVVTASDVRSAIKNSKAVYPDVIKKYLVVFDEKFKDLLDDDKRDHIGLNDSDKAREIILRKDLLDNKEEVKKTNLDEASNSSDNTNNNNDNNEITSTNDSNSQSSTDNKEDNNTDQSQNNINQNVNPESISNNEVNNNSKNAETNENKANNTNLNDSQKVDKIDTIDELNSIYDKIINPFNNLRKDE